MFKTDEIESLESLIRIVVRKNVLCQSFLKNLELIVVKQKSHRKISNQILVPEIEWKSFTIVKM